MTRAEAILQALVTLLTVPPMAAAPATHVLRDEEQAIEQALLPAVVLTEGDEADPARINFHEVERFLEVRLAVIGKGTLPYAAADAALIEAHGRIYAAQTLGGLCEEIVEGPTRRERADANVKLGRIEKTYRIRYRTTEGVLS